MIEVEIVVIISLISLGFFGGFSHCIGMCGPFVVTQVTNRMQNIAINDYGDFEKLKNLALLPYHSGRVFTYSILGLVSGFLSEKISDFVFFKKIAAFFMLIAALAFLNQFFEQKISLKKFIPKLLKINFLKKIKLPLFNSLISNLFKSPTGFKGFLLGVILGFIPCGMIYAAIALILSLQNPALSMLGMFLFGLATFPALFVTGCGSYFFIKKANFWLISKAIMLINATLLILFALKLIS